MANKNNLKYHRIIKGYTQDGLADLVGSSQSYIANIESGARNPGPKLLLRFTQVLEVPAVELFPYLANKLVTAQMAVAS